MKLRIRVGILRLHLKRSKVEQLKAGDSIVEKTRFRRSVLIYRLDLSDNGAISAAFGDGTLVVNVPGLTAAEWANTDQMSFNAEQSLTNDVTLY